MQKRKPRIFINIHYLEIGGAERALLGLLNAIDTNNVEVDLFINQHTGAFMPLIPKGINLLPENNRYATLEKPMISVLRNGHVDIVAARMYAKLKHYLFLRNNKGIKGEDGSIFHYVGKYTIPLLPSLRKYGEYDLAISFLTPHHIVANKVHAKRKIAWIHTDYSTVMVNVKEELPVWDSYDKIISISPQVTETFSKSFPSLRNKIVEIENILSSEFIKKQAKSKNADGMDFDGLKILSIGRYTYAKNFESIPYIAKILREHGLRFKWYIIGVGDDSLIRKHISETETSDSVILLGQKSNPYPYIAACNLYAQPSRYEGKSVTVREAQILHKPAIITNYPTASSQINDGIDGIICGMGINDIAQGIISIANSSTACDSIISYLSNHDYGNEAEIDKLYRLIPKHSN